MSNAITHTEYDVSLRLVEVWYDSTWAYLMSSHASQIAKRVDKRRRHLSSSASVASSVGDSSISGKPLVEKLETLQDYLTNVRARISYAEFKELCACCLKGSDHLYPGFRDVVLICHYLFRENATYRGLLTEREIDKISLSMIYQCIYYQMCDYLLHTARGSEAMKLLATPTKITHAAYDICRQKFCRLLVDEIEIIQYGLFRLIKKVKRHRAKSAAAEPTPSTTPPPPEDDEGTTATPDEADQETPPATSKEQSSPAPVEPAPVDPAPVDPAPVEPAPVDPTPPPAEEKRRRRPSEPRGEPRSEPRLRHPVPIGPGRGDDDDLSLDRSIKSRSSVYSVAGTAFYSPYGIARADPASLPRPTFSIPDYLDDGSISSIENDD